MDYSSLKCLAIDRACLTANDGWIRICSWSHLFWRNQKLHEIINNTSNSYREQQCFRSNTNFQKHIVSFICSTVGTWFSQVFQIERQCTRAWIVSSTSSRHRPQVVSETIDFLNRFCSTGRLLLQARQVKNLTFRGMHIYQMVFHILEIFKAVDPSLTTLHKMWWIMK